MTSEPTPELTAAIAALSSLRDAYPYLVAVAEAEAWGGRERPRPAWPMGTNAQAAVDELLRTERAERIHADRAGIRQSGNTHSPVRPDLLDAELEAHRAVTDSAWLIASELRQVDTWLSASANLRGAQVWATATAYVGIHVWDVSPALAARVARELDHADTTVRAACRLGSVRAPIPGQPRCPRCSRRSLVADVTSPEEREWTIACRLVCLCVGEPCACHRPGRSIGQQHVWSATHFATRWGVLRDLRRLAESQARGVRHAQTA